MIYTLRIFEWVDYPYLKCEKYTVLFYLQHYQKITFTYFIMEVVCCFTEITAYVTVLLYTFDLRIKSQGRNMSNIGLSNYLQKDYAF